MTKDQLLEEEEGPLVVDLLTDLDGRLPHVLGGESGAVGALTVGDDVLDLEDLLKDGIREDLGAWNRRRRGKGISCESAFGREELEAC
jgi:hypothetical protein